MSNLNPFEIRLELLKIAKEMLEQEYYAKREVIRSNWERDVELSKSTFGANPPAHPDYPPYPSGDEVIFKANVLNNFVSLAK
jgi:hypothetical protein